MPAASDFRSVSRTTGDIRRDDSVQWFYDLVRAQTLHMAYVEATAKGGRTIERTDEIVVTAAGSA